MDEVLAGDHDGPGRDLVLANRDVFERPTTNDPHRRKQPHRFGEHRRGVRKFGRVFQPRQSVRAEHGVDFGLHFHANIVVLGQEVPGPRQRVGGGLVPGEEEGHGLVPHFGIGQSLLGVLRILGRQQHRKEIAVIAAILTSIGDDGIDGFIIA